MSTIEDFENAPVGATATNQDGSVWVWKEDETNCLPWVYITYDGWLSNEELVEGGFSLNPAAPTTAREALALAWELSHPVKVGDVIPAGDVFLSGSRDHFTCEKAYRDAPVGPSGANWFRTLDPLPDPEPDWLDAPAVMAHAEDEEPHVWVNIDAQGWRDEHGNTRQWTALRDVTPLYPKENA